MNRVFYGNGYGYGNGDGDGDGDGYGYGYGYGNGNGKGYGDGYGYGNGNGKGDGKKQKQRVIMATKHGVVVCVCKDGWVHVGRLLSRYSGDSEFVVLSPAANVRRWNGSDHDDGIGALQNRVKGHKLDYFYGELQIKGSDIKYLLDVTPNAEEEYMAFFKTKQAT